jgi:hypothetical protein
MKQYFKLIVLFILAGFSSCKYECKTCPDGYGVVNDACECIGYINGGQCYTFASLLRPDNFKFQGDLYYSFDSNSSENFEFNTNPQLISISAFAETGQNSEFAKISLIENREAENFDNVVLRTSIQRIKDSDSAWFQPYIGEKGFGPGSTAFSITKIIGDKTCYLRPYAVQLDNTIYRLHLKWETEDGEVIDSCTKTFIR